MYIVISYCDSISYIVFNLHQISYYIVISCYITLYDIIIHYIPLYCVMSYRIVLHYIVRYYIHVFMRIHMVVVSMKNDVSNQNGTLFWKILQKGSNGRTRERPHPLKTPGRKQHKPSLDRDWTSRVWPTPKIPEEAPSFSLFNLRKKKKECFPLSHWWHQAIPQNWGTPSIAVRWTPVFQLADCFKHKKLGGFTVSFQKLSEICILCCVTLPPLTFHLYNCKFTSRCQAFYYWRVLGCKRVSMPKFIQWALNYGWLTGIWGRAWPNQQTNEQFFAKFGSTHFCWDGHIISPNQRRRVFLGFCWATHWTWWYADEAKRRHVLEHFPPNPRKMLKEQLLFEGFLGQKFYEFEFFSSCFK